MEVPLSHTYADTLTSLELSGRITPEQSAKMWEEYKNMPDYGPSAKVVGGISLLGLLALMACSYCFG